MRLIRGSSITETIYEATDKCRYILGWQWERGAKTLGLLMLNPSTARPDKHDHTTRKVVQIAKHNGFGGVIIANVIPYKTPSPEVMCNWLRTADMCKIESVIDENQIHVRRAAKMASRMVMAYGNRPSSHNMLDRALSVAMNTIYQASPARHKIVYCFGENTNGTPRHPLSRGKNFVPATAGIIKYRQWDGVYF